MKDETTKSEVVQIAENEFQQLLDTRPELFSEGDRALYVYAFLDGYLKGHRHAFDRIENTLKTPKNKEVYEKEGK